ncbi:WhiB family transcriptional regulator (plasmid) [Streptomyces sp. NBC_00015]
MGIVDWSERGVCGLPEAEALFSEPGSQHEAKAVCNQCPVRAECLAYALDQRIEFGVWGGKTERERRAMLRRRPGILSWHRILTTIP